MLKKLTIIIISIVLLAQAESFAQRGGRGGFGNFGQPAPFDANAFRSNRLLNYLQDANGVKIDPNSLSDAQLEDLYNRISMGDRGGVIDTSRFTDILSELGGSRGGRGGFTGMFPQGADANNPNEMIPVNLSQVDVRSIIQMLVQWTGKSIYPSPELLSSNIMITIYSQDRMPKSKALSLLYTAIRDQGFVIDETDDLISIRPASQIQRAVAVELLGEDDPLETILDKTVIVRKIFRLRNYSPSAMGQIIYPFLDSYGYLTADESSGTLMITDSVETLLRVQLIIQQFDIKLADTVTEILQVQHRDPQEMADLLTSIMANNSIQSTSMLGGFNMGMMMPNMNQRGAQNRTTAARQTRGTTTTTRNQAQQSRTNRRGSPTMGMTGIMGVGGAAAATAMSTGTTRPDPIFIAEPTTKCVIARATPDDMVIIKDWLAKLDTSARIVWNPADLTALPKNEVVEKFYYLQYNTPEQIAQIVEPLLTDSGYLSAEQNTGTLLVIDTAETLLQIEGIIQRFDVPGSDPAVNQIFPIQYGDPQEIANLINMILNGTTSGTSGSTSRFGATTRTAGGRTSTRTSTRTGGFGGRGG